MRGNVFLRSIFQIKSSDGGVSKLFLRSYKKTSTALDDGDLDEAKGLIDKLDADDPIHNYMVRVKQVVDSDESIGTPGTVSRSCEFCEESTGFWRHVLNRSHFSIDQVVGQLSEIEIVCQNSSVTVSYSPDMAWKVNRDGGDCSVKVFSDMDTNFRLVELANET